MYTMKLITQYNLNFFYHYQLPFIVTHQYIIFYKLLFILCLLVIMSFVTFIMNEVLFQTVYLQLFHLKIPSFLFITCF